MKKRGLIISLFLLYTMSIQAVTFRVNEKQTEGVENVKQFKEILIAQKWICEIDRSKYSYLYLDELELYNNQIDFWKTRIKESTTVCELTFSQKIISNREYSFYSTQQAESGTIYIKRHRIIPLDHQELKYRVYKRGLFFYLKIYGNKRKAKRYLVTIVSNDLKKWELNLKKK